MGKAPRLFVLCMVAIKDELLQGDDNNDILSVIYGLPSELFDCFLPHLPPLALHKLQENMPMDLRDDFEAANDYKYNKKCRKRRRCGILDTAWRELYKIRWPGCGQQMQKQVDVWLKKHAETKCDSIVDWQQMYWEAHLQDCVDAVVETAWIPSYDGSIGEIRIPDAILEVIGCRVHLNKLTCNYLKFFYHCQQFGIYARYLRLPNVLCVAETCLLLQRSKLASLELQWIKSNDHVEGLCKLLNQNSDTLKSLEFIHCKLSPSFINAICDSLPMKGLKTHGIEHFSMKRSSFLLIDSSPIPVGLASFLTSGRSLRSLTLCDDQLGRNFARVIFNSLLDASASISILDLSENNISGFLSQFRWRSSNCTLGLGRSLNSLRVLNLRCCNLIKEDVDCLKPVLVNMRNLENLDLSDNSLEDGIRSLIPYFTEISRRELPFVDLKLENCDLTCNNVSQLLRVLSTMRTPLNVLSIKGNSLGSKIGTPLAKFICSGVRFLDVEDIGLGSSGFLEALGEISNELKLVSINISNNKGGTEAAKFVARLISNAREVVAIDARYNLMPLESLSMIFSALKDSKGKLEHLDLAGNVFGDQLIEATSISSEFRTNGQFILNISLSAPPNAPYDNDP